ACGCGRAARRRFLRDRGCRRARAAPRRSSPAHLPERREDRGSERYQSRPKRLDRPRRRAALLARLPALLRRRRTRVRRTGAMEPATAGAPRCYRAACACFLVRSEEHTSELQSREKLVCRLLLEKKKR